MQPAPHTPVFEINIKSLYIRTVYLSCSWRPDEGKSASWVVVRDLDSNGIRAIGDVRDQPEQDPVRIKRIMQGTSGFVCILPYRDNAFTTSQYILQELCLAIQSRLPVALFYDDRVKLSVEKKDGLIELSFPGSSAGLDISFPVQIPLDNLFGPFRYRVGAEDSSIEEQLRSKISNYVDYLKAKPQIPEPYAFVFSRLNNDFSHARSAIKFAIEQTAGVPALWIDNEDLFQTNIHAVREKTRELLRNAEFVVVDLSRSAETPYNENPTLAFELGQADFSGKQTFVSLKRLRQYQPYYAIADKQLVYWQTEEELHRAVSAWIEARKTSLGRYVYNHSDELQRQGYTAKIKFNQKFSYVPQDAYKLEVLSVAERVLLAIALSIIVFGSAQLFEEVTTFDSSYDLLSIIASIVAGLFASFFNSIQVFLARNKLILIGIYILTIVMLVILLALLIAHATDPIS